MRPFAREQDQGAARAARLEDEVQERAQQLLPDHFPGDGLRRLDHREQVDLLGLQRHGRRRARRPGLDELRVPPFEIARLAVGAPAEIAVARLAQVRVGDEHEAAPAVEARGRFVGDRFVVDEAAVARRADRRFVQALGLLAIAVDPRELRGDERRPVLEVLRAAPGPDLQLPVV